MNKQVIKFYKDVVEWFNKPIDKLSFDTETTSLDYQTLDVVGISFYDGEDVCYVDLVDNANRDLIFYALDSYLHLIKLIAHNIVFDLKVLWKFGVRNISPNIICTSVAAQLLNENQPRNLDYLTLKHFNKEKVKWEDAVKHGYQSDEFYNYGMDDAIDCWNLWQKEKPLLEQQGLEHLFYDVEMPFQLILRDMEINGIKVNKEKLQEFKNACNDIHFELEHNMLGIFHKKHIVEKGLYGSDSDIVSSPINFNSSPQLVAAVESNLGIKITEKTKPSKAYPEGQKSINKNTIVRLKDQHPFFDLLHKYKRTDKLLSTYIPNTFDKIDSDDRIRVSFDMTKTGRMRCSLLHQLPNPKRGEYSPVNFREIFIPQYGYGFVVADFSGQELRNLAEVSQDEKMQSAFKNNQDLHLFVANYIFNLGLDGHSLVESMEEHSKAKNEFEDLRYKAKNGVVFPLIYGAGATSIANKFNVSREEVSGWMDKFFELFPDVKKAIDETQNEVKKQQYVSTLMGRRRRFPEFWDIPWRRRYKIFRQAFNFKIQGFSADQMKIAAVKLYQILDKYKAKIVLIVHDEIICEVPLQHIIIFAKEMQQIMENAVSLSIPFLVDVKILRNNYGE